MRRLQTLHVAAEVITLVTRIIRTTRAQGRMLPIILQRREYAITLHLGPQEALELMTHQEQLPHTEHLREASRTITRLLPEATVLTVHQAEVPNLTGHLRVVTIPTARQRLHTAHRQEATVHQVVEVLLVEEHVLRHVDQDN